MKDKGRVANLEAIDGINDLKSTIGIAHKDGQLMENLQKKILILIWIIAVHFAVVHNGIIENYHELKEFFSF